MKPVDGSNRRDAMLNLEQLEDRTVMAGVIADQLSDVTVTATSAVVVDNAGTPDAAGPVLVFNGTSASDVITVSRDPSVANRIKIVIGKTTTFYDGPFQAIIVHGGAGNDRITIDPTLDIDCYLYGGAGNDVITGGLGDDVIVGGDGTDTLSGGGGNDFVIGGAGADILYGNAKSVPGTVGESNIVLPDNYADEYNPTALRSLMGVWTNGASRQTRLDALADELDVARRPVDTSNDTVNLASVDDVTFTGPKEKKLVNGEVVTDPNPANIAQHLSDVTVTPTGATITPTGGPPDAAGPVLVLNGTSAGDVITVTRDPVNANRLKIVIGKTISYYEGPFQALVIHGGAGNDRITIDPTLDIDCYLYGGAGNDVITGALGNDVIVGGDGNDILTGAGGRDLIVGSAGTDTLYGNAKNVPAGAGESNILLPDNYADQYDVSALKALMGVWTSGASLEARIADLADELDVARRPVDTAADTVDLASLDDVTFIGAKEKMMVNGVVVSPPNPANISQHLSDVTVTPTGATITPTGGAPDAAGPVLVINGTAANDVITVTRDATNPNRLKIVIGKTTTYYTGPFQGIVVHGGAGNDTITIDPEIGIDVYLYGGAGNDTITGSNGADVIIGGEGNDVLIGLGGDDLLVGGNGADKLYGNDRYVPAAVGEENILLPDYYADEYSLVALVALMDVWTSGASLAARTAALADELDVSRRLVDAANDTVFEASTDDLTWLGSKEFNRFLIRGLEGANFATPTLDKYGFTVYTVDSIYQSSTAYTSIRVLFPTDYNSALEYKVIYVLPVESGSGSQYGDGLRTIQNAGLQNTQDAIYVAPTFSALPWYADHVSKPNIRQETYIIDVLLPFIEGTYETVDGAAGRLLLGFSKSGYGAYTMLMRHPDVFDKAFAWDSPFVQTSTGSYGMAGVYGSEAYFDANYNIVNMLPAIASEFQSGPPRFAMMSGPNFKSHHVKMDQLMTQNGIQHVVVPGIGGSHSWNINWVAPGVEWLLS